MYSRYDLGSFGYVKGEKILSSRSFPSSRESDVLRDAGLPGSQTFGKMLMRDFGFYFRVFFASLGLRIHSFCDYKHIIS